MLGRFFSCDYFQNDSWSFIRGLIIVPTFLAAPEGSGSPVVSSACPSIRSPVYYRVCVCVWERERERGRGERERAREREGSEASFSSFLPFSERTSLERNGAPDPEVSCPPARLDTTSWSVFFPPVSFLSSSSLSLFFLSPSLWLEDSAGV